MKGWIRKTWMGCVVALALGVPVAHADGGRIVFSGAIMEPTCTVGAQRIDEVQTRGARQYRCTERADATPGQAAQSYALSVTRGSALQSDQLIGYFAHYLNADPKLVTQTYD
ncbi:hypothetical protein P5Y53_17865 [Dyella jiangningensis]|jgi:hypothetical protein|uniref:hypothetical protein n=1 Tax=Dyella jiangningensis TaxID=1379159 RepID=UPI002410A69A|nr:hypothetical protein [Dyella jiangningensis]MDG2539550.1 hypothetical protein [Dyella jiangningensis]